VDAGSEFADEGTAGHAVFEALLLGRSVPEVVGLEGERTFKVTPELRALVDPCVEWAHEYKKKNKAAIFAEQKYEIGAGFGLEPGIFWGTADFTGISPTELCVADLKLGYVDVVVGENEQLISYGLGALDATGWIHDTIRLVILQPKTSDEPKEVIYTAAEMEGFRTKWKDRVFTAARGGPLVPSEVACRFCKAAGACPALRSETLALAQREMVNLITLSGEEIADLLNKGTMIENAMKAVRAHAIRLLEIDPASIPGYKRVDSDKKRVWKDEAEEKLQSWAKVVDVYEKALRSPAQIEKLIAEKLPGKTKKEKMEAAKKIISELAYKPKGGPTLVKDEDDRPALGPVFTKEDLQAAELID
jgi:hypothetical protein